MKHLRLFLVAIATVFGLGASAQTWTASEVGEGAFYLYNVGAQGFLVGANNYGTRASIATAGGISVTLAQLSDGKFSVSTAPTYNNLYLGANSYIDRPMDESSWQFIPVEGQTNVYKMVCTGGTFYADEGATTTSVGTDPDNAFAYWKLVTKENLIADLASATADNPKDATFLILNPNFSKFATNSAWTMEASNQNLQGGADANRCAESFHSLFTLSQVISGAPSGTYGLTAQGFYRQDGSDNEHLPVIYVNNGTSTFGPLTGTENNMDQASTSFLAGNYAIAEAKGVSNGELTIGAKLEGNTNLWCIWDNFQLKYYGLDLSEFATALANAVSAAEALNGQIPSVAYNTLQTVVNENNKTYTTAEDYTAATNAILAAIETAKALQKEFGRYLTVKNAIFGISSTIDATTSDAQANAAKTAAEIDQAVNTIREALLGYLPNATIAEGNYIDLTDALIDNPTVSQNVDYWTVSNVSTSGTGPTTNFEETEFYNRNFKFFQTLTLNKGTYEFGVTGFHRAGNHSTYFYAGDNKILIPGVESSVVNDMAQAKTYFDGGNGEVALKFALEGESNTIEIGIDNQDTQTDKWTIFRNFTLHYFGSAVDLTPYQNAWAEAVSAAQQAITDNPNVTGDELTAVNTAKADTPEETIDSYTEKTNALVEATQALKAAAPSYNAYAAEKAIAERIGLTNISAPTTAAAAAAGVNTLKVAEFNYVKENYPYDYEPVIGTFGEWIGTATVIGAAAEPNYLDNEHWSGQAHAYYEQASNGWGSNAWTIKYEKKAKLPAGDYMLKVAARSSEDVTGYIRCSAATGDMELPHAGAYTKGIDLDGNASFEGDNFARDGVGFGWEWRFLPFSLTEETEVTMTVYGETNKQHNWMSISDGTLLSKQEISNVVELKGTDTEVVEAQVAAEVNTDRKLLSGLNTVIFPFETTATELGVATVLEYTGTTSEEGETTVTLKFKEVAPVDGVITLQANVPYAVFVDADQTEDLTFGMKNINPAEELVTPDPNKIFDFVGTYVELKQDNSIVKPGDLVAGAKEFKKAKGGNRMQAYRAFLSKVNTGDVNVAFNFNGEIVNGIEAVEIFNRMSGDIYNLNGQKVSRTQKGVYIINGKKVVVK